MVDKKPREIVAMLEHENVPQDQSFALAMLVSKAVTHTFGEKPYQTATLSTIFAGIISAQVASHIVDDNKRHQFVQDLFTVMAEKMNVKLAIIRGLQ